MHHIAKLALVSGVLLAFSSTANASMLIFSVKLDAAQEVPTPDISGGFTPKGSGMLTLDTTSLLLTWDIMYEGLTGPIVAPGAHLHRGAPGVTGPIEVDLVDMSELPLPASGQLVGSTTIMMTQANDLIAGNWYVNIHTERNPPGEIRGQVELIPEPGTIVMMSMGGAGLAGFLRFRRRRSPVGA